MSEAGPYPRNAPCPCGSGKRYKHCHGLAEGDHAVRGSWVPGREQVAGNLDQARQRAELALQRGNPRDALVGADQALEQFPRQPDLALIRVNALLMLGQQEGALASARELALSNSQRADVWLALGKCLARSDLESAEAAFERATTLDSGLAEASFELAQVRMQRGNPRGAQHALEAGLAKHPNDAQLHNNLGLALEAQGGMAAAEAAYSAALRAAPNLAPAQANQARLLAARGEHLQAVPLFQAAAPALGSAPELWSGLAVSLQAIGRLEEAATAFKRALDLCPGHPELTYNLGAICFELRQPERAVGYLRDAIALRTDFPAAASLLLHLLQQTADWASMPALLAQVPKWVAGCESTPLSPFRFLSLPTTAAEQLRIARATRSPSDRLRLGYFSCSFREHPVATLIAEVLERHDRRRVELFLYSYGPNDGTPTRRRMEGAAEHFTDLAEVSFRQMRERILADQIDVLIDLDGHTQHSRSTLLASRLAPVQINYLGYPGTLGTHYHDYVLTDRVVTPPSEQDHFSERFLYLPHCYMPSDTTRKPFNLESTRTAWGLPEEAIVYCVFNQVYKILPEMFAVWMRVLKQVPGSVLWMLVSSSVAQDHLRRQAQAQGIDPLRLVFAPNAPLAQHLARYPLADLFLDSLPYNAHTTCNDALLMGVPVLSRIGNSFVSRVAASHLHAVGLAELVVATEEEYVELAVSLARDRDRLGAYRRHLITRGPSSPLFDMAAFARNLEDCVFSASTAVLSRAPVPRQA